jgi:hypothetical protein
MRERKRELYGDIKITLNNSTKDPIEAPKIHI